MALVFAPIVTFKNCFFFSKFDDYQLLKNIFLLHKSFPFKFNFKIRIQFLNSDSKKRF